MTKKKLKKIRLPQNAQEYYDIDYWTKLSDEDKQWYTEFMDGTLGNNHRFYDIFTEHKDYKKMSKQIYNETNCRNRDIYSMTKSKNMLLSIDFLSDTKEERYINKILNLKLSKESKERILINFGIKTFEEISTDLMENVIAEIQTNNKKNHIATLLNYYIIMNTLVKEENKYRRNNQ